MGNSWFQFQQFRIEQGRSGMKVCTDSCLFGAFIPVDGYYKIIDVGAGTGLLGLMAAQRNLKVEIDFLEPDSGSFLDLELNISQSPWANRCHAQNRKLKDWTLKNQGLYDMVLCNPPYFIDHLISPASQRNMALHMEGGEWQNWLFNLSSLVKQSGIIWLLLPAEGFNRLETGFGPAGLQPVEIHEITQNKRPFRYFVGLKLGEEVAIKKAQHELRCEMGTLSGWANDLMKNYYLRPLPLTPSSFNP